MTKNQFFMLYNKEKERLSVYPNINVSCSWNEEKGYKSLFYSLFNKGNQKIETIVVCLDDYGYLSQFLNKKVDVNDKFKPYLSYELLHFSDKPYLLNNRLDSCTPYLFEQDQEDNFDNSLGRIDIIGYWVNNYIDEHSWNMENGSRKYSNWLYVENSGHGNANTPALKVERFQLDFNSEDNVQQKEFYNPYKLYNAEYIEKCKQNEEQQNTIDEDYQER